MAEFPVTPVTKQMLFDLILENREQVESLHALIDETLAEARAINEKFRAWRESLLFRATQKGDHLTPC
jgi:hypothetical protein